MSAERTARLGPWIHVNAALPEIGVKVEVKGAHTPEGHEYPFAWRNDDPRWSYHRIMVEAGIYKSPTWTWESTEWRGTVGITHWRRILDVRKINFTAARRRATR